MNGKSYDVFWQAAHYLIVDQHYRLISLSPDHNELWLEREDNKGFEVVRLFHAEPALVNEFDRSAFLKNDFSSLAEKGERIRKQMKKRKLTIDNYLFYDELENNALETIESPSGENKRCSVRTILVNVDAESMDIENNRLLFRQEHVDHEFEHEMIERVRMLKTETLLWVKKQQSEEQQLFNVSKPIWSYIIAAIHLIMFYLLETNGGSTDTQVLIDFGAKYNPLINEGEWYRFFTPMFLHIGIFHLFMNTLALFYLGPFIERVYGRSRFLIIYFTAGFTGSLMSFVFSFTISAGASGAIFGCLGALLYFGLRHKKVFFRTMGSNVLIVIAINLSIGFALPGIDNAAHIGGLIGGFLAAGVVSLPNEKKAGKKVLYLITVLLWIIVSLYVGYNGAFVQMDPVSVNALAHERIKNGEFHSAYDHLSSLEKEGEATPETYFLLAYIQLNEKDYRAGSRNLEKAINGRSDFHEAHYNLALVQMELGDNKKALEHAKIAKSVQPDHEPYEKLVDELMKEN
ncbi:rhomboid family protein [Jeotgalibacillus campisalis]|uniref:Rhomboid protease n=1 Tax=Jeotgalibacillus campisalis TaxID=220754 RepID=A0A0C2VAM7_9BACL|nr:rhomboid family intramembrane serine protease [Jeotgalibacillus campisalis]KIL45992.1 rhomboid protease [Jeotgalibacillus campisalis]